MIPSVTAEPRSFQFLLQHLGVAVQRVLLEQFRHLACGMNCTICNCHMMH
jgi:hypothetical protein